MADGVGKGSRVVGSADFVRPVMPQSDVGSKALAVVEGVKCAMPFSVKFAVPSGQSEADAKQKVEEIVLHVLELAEKTFSTFVPESEISRFNNLKAGQPHEMTPAFREVILASKEMYNRTRGCFDPSLAPILKHYQERCQMLSHTTKPEHQNATQRVIDHWQALANTGFGDSPSGRFPKSVENLRKFCNFRDAVEFSTDKTRISKTHDQVQLELSGIAKGWAIDQIADKLEQAGITSCFVDWAGDIKVKGMHPAGRKWTIAVAEPPTLEAIRAKAERALETASCKYLRLGTVEEVSSDPQYLAVLELSSGDAVATSGDYEQVFMHDGKIYSHILNPNKPRLLPVNDDSIAQVVVVLSSCMYADALATAAMSCEDVRQARVLLDPFRTAFQEPMSDFLLYARGGPRVVRMLVAGIETKTEREARLKLHKPATVVVVGGGLAGLSAAIEAADCGANVILLEKEPKTGGNSAKATSGINGWGTETQAQLGVPDEERLFERDTFRSGKGGSSNTSLVRTLSTQSASAIHWLKKRFNIPLTVLSQLGGHSAKRTHRAPPDEHGRPVPIGYLITNTLKNAVESEYQGKIEVRCGCHVTKLLHIVDEATQVKTVTGVEMQRDGKTETLESDSVILATGGFGCDRSSSGLMAKYRPDLAGCPTTNGAFAVGEGVQMAEALGANLIDMDKVQLHPTGFIDPKDPSNPTKYLAPEAIRGSGGILVNSEGIRFVNELDLRSVVAAAIQKSCSPFKSGDYEGPPFAWCILGAEAQELFGPPVLSFYKDRLGLWESCSSVEECAAIIGCHPQVLAETLREYDASREKGTCLKTGKYVFPSRISEKETNLVLARVTPSIHYTMGGLEISAAGEVQELIQSPVFGGHRHIRGLFAAGEVTGGVHGANRLGGNSLAECVVFGRIAGDRAATILNPSPYFFRNYDHEQEGCDGWVPCVMREVRNTDEKYGKNTREVRFNLHGSLQKTGLKVGQYVAIRGELDGETLLGYFSPITRPGDEGVIGILCRVDDKGGPIVRFLEFIRPGSTVKIKAVGGLHVDFSHQGIFWKGRQIKKFGLLAGGTGIAPMLQIVREYCHFAMQDRKYNGGANLLPMGLNLLYAAEEESDLSYVKILHTMRERFPEDFRFYLILNKPPLGWTEGVGFVKPTNIKKNLFFPPADDQLIVICGPPIFEKIMLKMLGGLGFAEHHIYAFSKD